MADHTITIQDDPRVTSGTKISVDLPNNFSEDDIHKAVEMQLDARYGKREPKVSPEEEKTKRANFQGLQGGTDLSKEQYPSNTAPPGYRSTSRIPVLSDIGDRFTRAVHAPISGQSSSDKAADIIEGGGEALMYGGLPAIGANLGRAAVTAIPAIAAQQAVQKVSGNRLAGDLTGMAVGGIEAGSPKVRGATEGGVKGGLGEILNPTANRYGIPVPPAIAGATAGEIIGRGVGHPEAGAVIGGALPVAKGIYKGAAEGGAGKPWINKPLAKDVPFEAPYLPVRGPSINQTGMVQDNPADYNFLPAQGETHNLPPAPDYLPVTPPSAHNPPYIPPYMNPLPPQSPPDIFEPPYLPVEGQTPKKVATPRRKAVYKPRADLDTSKVKINETSKTPKKVNATSNESEGPKHEAKDSKAESKNINPAMDKILTAAGWDGDKIGYSHISKVSDALGLKPKETGHLLTQLGYDVAPPKSGKYGLDEKKDLLKIFQNKKLGEILDNLK